MIVKRVFGDVISGPERHILFAINTEGLTMGGFAGMISRRYWPELVTVGTTELGRVLSKEVDGKVFHAIVCHKHVSDGGWDQAPQIIKKTLDELDIPDDEVVATIEIGGGIIGQETGASLKQNIQAMIEARRKVVLYVLC